MEKVLLKLYKMHKNQGDFLPSSPKDVEELRKVKKMVDKILEYQPKEVK